MAPITPKVGISMLAYNQGKYLDEAIKSLSAQTFQDFEVHIIDDGSTDGITPAKLRSIKYDKATIFPNRDNKGASFRRRQHLRLLKNPYIIHLCADDKLAPTYIEKCLRLLQKHPEYAGVCSYIQNFGDNDNYCKIYKERTTLPKMLVECHYLGSAVWRREALSQIKIEPYKRQFDYDMFISLLEKGWQLGIVKEALFYYRQVDSSLSHTNAVKDELDFRAKLYNKHKAAITKHQKAIYLCFAEVLYKERQDAKTLLQKLNHEKSQNLTLAKENIKLHQEIQKIHHSLAWKLLRPLRRGQTPTKKKMV